MTVTLHQTEKAYTLQERNVFVLIVDKKSNLNKIQLNKALKSTGLNPIKINKVNSYSKAKKRGKFWNTKLQKRPNKFMVYLPQGELLNETNLETVNNYLIVK